MRDYRDRIPFDEVIMNWNVKDGKNIYHSIST